MKRKIQLYLHDYIILELTKYGDLKDVIYKIFDAVADGIFDITDLPKVPPRKGAMHIDLIFEHYYLDNLYALYGENSRMVNIRRIIYGFVEQQAYHFLGWQEINSNGRNCAKVTRIYENLTAEANKLFNYGIDASELLLFIERMQQYHE